MPLVTVILPIYNRAGFVPDALGAIAAQTWRDWELIVVDDGSTDDTVRAIEGHRGLVGDRLRVIRQDNAGPAAARNAGLDQAAGDYVAFYDSDDLWLPHHLESCVRALEAHPEVDWVYGASRAVRMPGGEVTAESTFQVDGRPRPFLSLETTVDGDLRIIDDPAALECQITSGLYAGLQASVVRRRVFERRRFWPEQRVYEDVLFLVGALAEGLRLAYFTDIHVIYRIHDGNTSAPDGAGDRRRLLNAVEGQLQGMRRLRREVALPATARRAARRREADLAFWHVGYGAYWQAGDAPAALRAFREALRVWPWDPWMWKTYLLCRLRLLVGRGSATSAPPQSSPKTPSRPAP